MYYLYHHIRLDSNEVFYVGIGKIYSKSRSYVFESNLSKYSRAYYVKNRSKFWRNIVSKTKYVVSIILESEDVEFIKKKEIEHINFYGRKDLGKGSLVNLTDGGDGIFNCSDETRKKMRDAHIGKNTWNKGKKGCQVAWNKGIKMSKEHGIKCTKNAHESNKKKCYIYNLEGDIFKEFNQIRDMINFLEVKNVNYYLDKLKIYKNEFILSTKLLSKDNIRLNSKKIKGGNFREVALIDDNGIIIKRFRTVTEAVKYYGISITSICKNISGLTKKTRLGVWVKV